MVELALPEWGVGGRGGEGRRGKEGGKEEHFSCLEHEAKFF